MFGAFVLPVQATVSVILGKGGLYEVKVPQSAHGIGVGAGHIRNRWTG